MRIEIVLGGEKSGPGLKLVPSRVFPLPQPGRWEEKAGVMNGLEKVADIP
jgi:hypothetical protein